MKKAVVLGMILLALGTLVYAADAGVKVTGWGRGLFAVEGGGDDTEATVSESWGNNSTRVGVSVIGTSDNVGFQVDIDTNTGAPEAGDQAKIWVKPFDMLTLSIGRVFDDTLRGSESYGAWNWLRYGGMSGDGAIFYRVGEGGQVNFEAALAPIEPLYVYAALGGNGTDLQAAPGTVQNVFGGGQFGFGYTITGIGVLRAQYIGAPAQQPIHTSQVFNAAFKLTAIPNLTADLGFFYAMKPDLSNWDEKIAVGADYTAMDALVLHAIGVVELDKVNDAGLEFGAGADYTIDKEAGLAINTDIRYMNDVASGNADGQVSFLLGVVKSFSNGQVGVGFELQTTGHFADKGPVSSDGSKMVWAIPVKVGMSF
jgi:hypothetical protein